MAKTRGCCRYGATCRPGRGSCSETTPADSYPVGEQPEWSAQHQARIALLKRRVQAELRRLRRKGAEMDGPKTPYWIVHVDRRKLQLVWRSPGASGPPRASGWYWRPLGYRVPDTAWANRGPFAARKEALADAQRVLGGMRRRT